MATDKRRLELEVKVDDKGTRPLKQIGDAADKAESDFGGLNKGLGKLDDQIAATAKQIGELRREVARSGDLDLIKDITKQEQRLKALSKQRKSLLGDALKPDAADAAEIGIGIGAKIGPFIVQSMSRAVAAAGPAVAIGAPIVAGLATYFGSVAAGGILAGAVTSSVTGGVQLAVRDSRVKTAVKSLGDDLMDQLMSASAAFVPATLGAIKIVRGEFRQMDDDLRGVFDAAAGYVQPLARGVTGLVRNLLPGIRRGLESALPIVKTIERGLPRIGDAIGDLFGNLADDADEAAMAIDYLFKAIEVGIRSVGGTLQVLTQVFGYADKISAAMSGNYERLAGYINAQAEAESGAGSFAAALQRLGETDPGIEELWTRQVLLNKSMAEGVKQAGDFGKMLDILNGKTLGAREAERGYQEAIDAITESIKENGKTLDINTEKGRNNQSVLDALAAAGQSRAQAIYEQTLATKGQVAAEAAAGKAYEQGRAQLIKSAQQFGLTKTQARALANQIMVIPREWSTRVNLVGHQEAIARAQAIERAVKRLTGKNIRIGISGVRSGVLEGLAEGGPVTGSGPKGVDSRMIMAAPGEHMWTAQEVDAAGGHRAVEAMRRSVLSGRPAPTAGARPSGGAISVVVNAGYIVTPQQLEDQVARVLDELRRKGRA